MASVRETHSTPVPLKESRSSKDLHSGKSPPTERRKHPRYKVPVIAEISDTEFGMCITAPATDISQRGLGVTNNNPFPVGTIVNVRMKKAEVVAEAQAKVVFSQSGMGMGLMFIAIDPTQRQIIESWLPPGHEASWLASTRRRSQRIHMAIPVQISGWGANGATFEEKSRTATISVSGALILLQTSVTKGQRLVLRNLKTEAALECVVVYMGKPQGAAMEVGVSFAIPNPFFWHVSFPPDDWSQNHPDAKSRGR